jgi:hypothetical protein
LSGGTVSSGGTRVYGFANGWKGKQLTGSSDSALNQGSTYSYDEFNRLASRTVNSGTGPNYGRVPHPSLFSSEGWETTNPNQPR